MMMIIMDTCKMLSLTETMLLHDRLHYVPDAASADDAVAPLLGQVHHGGAQPRLLAVTESSAIKDELETVMEAGELLHRQSACVVAQIGGGQRQGAVA